MNLSLSAVYKKFKTKEEAEEYFYYSDTTTTTP
jgi:viroplasmin and RNaseH domain-containing protein